MCIARGLCEGGMSAMLLVLRGCSEILIGLGGCGCD